MSKLRTKKKVQRKLHLNDFNVIDPTGVRIAFSMYRNKRTMTQSDIARDTKLTRQLVRYHLRSLIEKGLVLEAEYDGDKVYLLQPVFYDEDVIESIIDNIIPIVDHVQKHTIDINCNDEDYKRMMVECIQLIMRFVEIEVSSAKESFT